MESKIIELIGIAVKFILKCWSKDAFSASENMVDFAIHSKLSLIEARKFRTVFENIENQIAEDMFRKVQRESMKRERKEAIIEQIIRDIQKLNLDENIFLYEDFNVEKIKKEIMSYSVKEREVWDESELAFYNNYVKYLSKCMVEFVCKLPMYEPKALKLIIERQHECQKTLDSILEEISSVKEVLKNTVATYREFEEAYREYVIENNQKVELIGSGIKEKNLRTYNISAAYVNLNCIEDDVANDAIYTSDVFENTNVVWLKGEAGAGKTTFLQWIALCSAKNEIDSIHGIENTVPIIVKLRSVSWPLNIISLIRKYSENIDRTYPEGWAKQLLKDERALILLDGLDEIEQIKREEVYEFVENLVTKYPGVKILITARNSVKDKLNCNYKRYEICPMKIDNIKKFVSYWHKAVLYDDAIENLTRIKDLKRNLLNKILETSSLKNLIRNPLLCAMICALNYCNNEYLPSNRNDVYDKCCEMLIETRDVHRAIEWKYNKNIQKMDYKKKRRIIEELAYWMLRNGKTAEKEENVVEYLKNHLENTNILVDVEDVEEYSKLLLDYIVERSGIVRRPELGEIDFIHKTFMEYLSAKAICRNCDYHMLVREACNVNWKETILMCFGEMSKEKVSEILLALLNKGMVENNNCYFFIASLGAANAILTDNHIRECIDDFIKRLIPPRKNEIYEIAEVGTYLVPFLADSPQYSNDERELCIELLNYLNLDESIPQIMSYIEGEGSDDIKEDAIILLSDFSDNILLEYDVEERLYRQFLKSIENGYLKTYIFILRLIANRIPTAEESEILRKVRKLEVHEDCSAFRFNKKNISSCPILKYCNNIREIRIVGEIDSVEWIKGMNTVQCLKIDGKNDISSILFFSMTENIEKVIIEVYNERLMAKIEKEKFKWELKYDAPKLEIIMR